MSAWSKEELSKIAAADNLHISPFREDGVTYGTPTWIWSVAVDDALYVRGYNGQNSRWYQAAVRQKAPINDLNKVAAWLYRLAVTQTLLYRRKMGRQRKLVDRFAQRNHPSEQDNRQADPLTWLLLEERRQKIRLAIKRLARRDAEILLLKYTEDWSYRDLAERLGISESAVEARLHRARQRLRSELAILDVVEADVT